MTLDRTPEALPPFDDRIIAPVILEGRHVRLEPLSLEHGEPIAAAASGPRETYGWTWVPDGLAESGHYVRTILAEQAAGRGLPFATFSREGGTIVGVTRFLNIEYWAWPEGNRNQRGVNLPDAVEIGGTWLSAAAQRTPINTEAKLLMLRHAFETWHVHRVRLMTDSRNVRSRAAIERIGGKLDGVLRAHTPGSDAAIRDSAVYSLVEAEWPSVQARLEARLAAPRLSRPSISPSPGRSGDGVGG
ncbi:MAG: GNAT family N-acetyltransferase [Tepidiformaceae bacterium]